MIEITNNKRETKARRLQLLIKPSTYAAIKAAAEDQGTSVNEWINNALETAIDIQTKLQAYEDTGLTQSEIAALAADNERLHKLVDAIQEVLEK